jgi:GAF domain-containing protein/HAMP domain-containing protein
MPEKNRRTPFSRGGGAAAWSRRADAIGDAPRRAEIIQRSVLLFIIAGVVSISFFLAVYARTRAWQMGVAGGGLGLGLLLAFLALVLARRERADAAGYLLVAAVALVWIGDELAWSNATPYLMASGAFLIILAGSTALPRRRRAWLLALGFFGLAILLIQWFQPFPRFDVRNDILLRGYVWVAPALSAIALVWQMVQTYQRITTIRARLPIMSVATVLMTAIAISSGSILIGFRNGQRQAIDRLELVATLREVEIDSWVQHIQSTLAGSLQQAPEHRFVEPEMAEVVATLLGTPAGSEERRQAYEFLSYNFDQWLKQAQQFDVIFFMDRDGKVLVATDPALEGEVFADETYFNRGTVGSYFEPLSYSQSLGRAILFASRPILGEYGRLLGVLAGRVDGSSLSQRMRMREQASLGQTGETYLVGTDRMMLTDSRFTEVGTTVRSQAAERAMERQEEGSGTYENYRGDRVIGVYRWLPDLQVALIAEQSRSEALRAVNRTAALNGAISLVALVLAGAGAVVTARRIGDPLSSLARTASEIAAGDLERTAQIERRDEIGTLAKAFNQMTTQLRGLIGLLERRVAERTRDLELRSTYLEASAEVGRTASTMLDADELVHEVVGLIRDRFGLYYVGLFLIDEMGEWAELRAGTGEAGREMLAQCHRLMVGGQSMIGQCVARSEARIALDVGAEPVRFDNPLLPGTRSEAALPLESRGRVFGAITVQSAQPAAFDQDILTVLQTMADQVAVALDNAYLFREAEEALKAARRAQAESTHEAWAELLRFQPNAGYHSDARGVRPADDLWRPEMEWALREGQTIRSEASGSPERRPDRYPLALPIKVAGNVVGVVDTYKPSGAGPWTDDEVETLESLAEELGASLESARLHQETQRRAARERLVSEISASLRASMNPDTILKATVRGLGEVLDAELASVELTGPVAGDGGAGANGDVGGEEV